MKNEICVGCGGRFQPTEGPTHKYMLSSAACWARYGAVLEREYSTPELMYTHRLSVDSYAVQHPGNNDPRARYSVGLHLARLMLQVENNSQPEETNNMMLGLSAAKDSLSQLEPPVSFDMTVADIPLVEGNESHVIAVRAWAAESWHAWKEHHDYIKAWVGKVMG